jgi:hypothetical protein
MFVSKLLPGTLLFVSVSAKRLFSCRCSVLFQNMNPIGSLLEGDSKSDDEKEDYNVKS